jgi:hypothetical protein
LKIRINFIAFDGGANKERKGKSEELRGESEKEKNDI